MKKLAFLEYTFMFDPNDTFTSISEFERQFAVFLATKNMQAEIVNTVGGAPGKRVMLIQNMEKLDKMANDQNRNKKR